MRRLLALSMLVLALGAVLAPVVMAAAAMLRGDIDGALAAIKPLLLIPCAFIVAGFWFSVRRSGSAPGRHPPESR